MDSVKTSISIALVGGIALMLAFAANAAKIDDDIAIELLLSSHCSATCGAQVSHVAAGDSPAEPVSVFGLQLQRPLSLRECKFNRDIYVPCFKREHEADIGTKKPIENDDFIVGNWPSNST
jgi:hypothetical protein